MKETKEFRTSDFAYEMSDGEDNAFYIVGPTDDIKAIYKSIARNSDTIYPLYADSPIFGEKLIYGIEIENNTMKIVNSDVLLSLLLDGYIVPVEN